MALSYSTRLALGDNSSFLKRKEQSSVNKQIGNAQSRLQSVGADYQEEGDSQNFLLKTLDTLSRPGYGATNVIREFTNEYAGSTPQKFDPLAAFWRGLKGQDKAQGKDIFTDIGMEGDKGVFGGEAKWYNPSPAGAAGLALDIVNPLDPLNWIGLNAGDDIIKGASKGADALTNAFGATKGGRIAEILKTAAKTTDDLGAENVGKLVSQVTSKIDDVDTLREVTNLIQEGIAEKGLNATSKLDYRAMKPLQVGLQNPLSIGNSGMSVKLPGYAASGGKLKAPILYPGKDIAGTFKNIPGSEYATYAVSSIAKKVGSISMGGATLGQSLGKLFSTAFVPNTVPNTIIKKELTANNLADLVNLSKTNPENVPLSAEELMGLNDELANITVDNKFDYANNMSATDLKMVNKGNYLSVESLAKRVGLKGLKTEDVTSLLSDTPFSKTITELYDSLRMLSPTTDAKQLFTNAVKLRKMMDLMYDQIPEGIKPYFTGVLKSQRSDLYPSDITTHRLGKNVATSPLMAYEFKYNGVPISVVVNSGEDFNVESWAKLGATIEALDELPDTAIQALTGQIDVSPIPIKVPDTSMTIGDTIVLGRIDKSTVAHEYGHIWDNASGNPETYSKAILNDAGKIDDTITPDDLYSDYSRSIYDTDNTVGIKEDLADSVSDYLSDKKTFRELYPARAAEIERMLQDSSIPREQLAKMVTEQRKLADSVANVPRTENQIKSMLESVDKYAYKMSWEPGSKTYQTFRKNLSAMFEQTNWKTKQWQEQVGALFNGIDEAERKQIMDAAAQITGTEIPKNAKVATEPLFSANGDKLIPQGKGKYILYHSTTGEAADDILKNGFKVGTDVKEKGGSKAIFFSNNISDNTEMGYNFNLDNIDNSKTLGYLVDTNNLNITRITYDDRSNFKQKLLDSGIPKENIQKWLDWNMSYDDSLPTDEATIDALIDLAEKNGKKPSDVFGDMMIFDDGESGIEIAMFSTDKLKSISVNDFDSYDYNNPSPYDQWDPLYNKNPGEFRFPVDNETGEVKFTPQDIDTPAFKGWFGKSKVVNEDGTARIMYHGTSEKTPFTVFNTSPPRDVGAHFGTPEAANSILAGNFEAVPNTSDMSANVYPVYLNIKNPLEVQDAFGGDVAGTALEIQDALDARGANLYDLMGKMEKQTEILDNWPESEIVNQDGLSWDDFVKSNRELDKYAMDIAKKNGYDGLVYDNLFEGDVFGDNLSWVAFNPSQIKSATGNVGTFSKKSNDILYAKQDYPIFMSKLQEVTEKMPNKMSVDEFKNYLNSKQVKKEELKWTFMDDLLEGKTHVTKQEVKDWVVGNKLEVNEIWKSDKAINDVKTRYKNSWWANDKRMNEDRFRELDEFISDGTLSQDGEAVYDTLEYWGFSEEESTSILDELNNESVNTDGPQTKFSQYTQPGGEDYTELIFTLPDDYSLPKTRLLNEDDLAKLEARRAELVGSDAYFSSPEEYDDISRQLALIDEQLTAGEPKASESFEYAPHWGDTKNPVAHTRFDTRYTDDGKKVLFIDEIQSDWHQQGRDKGYKGDIDSSTWSAKLNEDMWEVFDDKGNEVGQYGSPQSEAEAIELAFSNKKYSMVPDAPFKTNWDEFVQKRMLRYAADNGYDGIAWSTGKQQAERWSQQVTEGIDTLQYNHNDSWLRAYKDGEAIINKQINPEELPSMVGADIARKLLDTTPDTFSVIPVKSGPSKELLADSMPDGMDAIEMLNYMKKHPEFNGSHGYKVTDQNGNSWGYVYPSEESALNAIEKLRIVEDTLKTVSGTNVTVGGEGMRKFYDQQVPSNFKKLGKKFGLNVEEIDLGAVNKSSGYSVGDRHSIIDSVVDKVQELNLADDVGDMARITELWGDQENYDGLTDSFGDLMDEVQTDDDLANAIAEHIKILKEEEYYGDYFNSTGDVRFFTSRYIDEFSSSLVDEGRVSTLGVQQGIWLDTKSRQAITQQSFPLYADNSKPVDNLTEGWSERQINALDSFLKWRNSVVKQYQQIGIPINELEKYVPFIPKRVLHKDEASVVRSIFGTGVQEATGDNFDTMMAELSKMDPNLKTRTTKANRPSEVNKLLKKEWLTEDAAVAMSIRGTRAIKAQELNSFADEFVTTYGLHASDMSKMTGNSIPEGYVAFKVGVDDAGNKIFQRVKDVVQPTADNIDTVFLPQDMVDLYNEYSGVMFNKEKQNGLVQMYDSLSQLYKKAAYLWNPGHIFRDFEGNVFNNYLMGVMDPTEYSDGLRAMRGMEGSIETPNGPIKYTDIYEQAQKLGIVDSVMAHEIPTISGKTESGYSKIMRKSTYATDGWTRTTGFIHNLKQGQSFEQAAATTKKFLFDYFDLTPFERKAMKRIVPFYTWMRKNIPLQLEVLLKNPRLFARINDVQNAAAGEVVDWDEKPDYIQDSSAIKGQNSKMYTNLSLPYQDLAKMPTNSDSMADLLSSVNPLIRAPIESITNQKWWTGEDLEDYSGQQGDIPILTTLMQMLGAEKGPQVGTRYAGNALNNIPILTRAGNLLDSASGKETSDVRNLSRVSTTFGGPSVYDASSVDNSADWQERQRLLELIQRLKDEGYEIPTSGEAKKEGRHKKLQRILGGQ